jgi:hypothetical protein
MPIKTWLAQIWTFGALVEVGGPGTSGSASPGMTAGCMSPKGWL